MPRYPPDACVTPCGMPDRTQALASLSDVATQLSAALSVWSPGPALEHTRDHPHTQHPSLGRARPVTLGQRSPCGSSTRVLDAVVARKIEDELTVLVEWLP